MRDIISLTLYSKRELRFRRIPPRLHPSPPPCYPYRMPTGNNMRTTFKISSGTQKAVWGFAAFIFLFFLGLLTTSGNDLFSILKIEALVAVFAFFFPILFSWIYISIGETSISFSRLGFFQVTVPIKKIETLSLLPSLVGVTKNVYIEHISSDQQVVRRSIGTANAFGKKTVPKIVERLKKVNPSIKVDSNLLSLLGNRDT